MEQKNNVADRKGETASAPAKPAQTAPVAEQTNAGAPEITDGPLINMEDALAILATSKSRSSGGSKIRPHVGYTLVGDKLPAMKGTSVPEQEQVVVKILLKALTTQKPVISEPELHKLVVAAHKSGTLKSKQDPWHIFRYYRTDLIKRGVLKQLEFATSEKQSEAA